MSLRHVVFRISGISANGFGHAARCCALARKLDGRFAPAIWADAIDSSTIDFIRSVGFQGTVTLKSAPPLTPALVVFDIYDPDEAEIDAWRAGGHLIVFIDDLGLSRRCDLLVSPGPQFSRKTYNPMLVSNALVGVEYALIDDRFYGVGRDQRREIESILISFGGIDPPDATAFVTEALGDFTGEMNVVLGAKYRGRLNFFDHDKSNLRIFRDVSTMEFIDLIRRADFAIAAGGVTSLELAASGTPMLLLSISDAQTEPCLAFSAAGMATYGGRYPGVDARLFRRNISAFAANHSQRLAMSLECRRRMQKSGAARVADAIMILASQR